MDAKQPESQRLRRDVEWALRRALDPSDVLPLLHRLARTAPEGSDESVFAHRQLAELLVERHPWRAALHARRALSARPDDERACAVLALCQTMLGNYRFAVSAYHRALLGAPKNPWYAHNLGHLLDVALSRPADALSWLRTAYAGAGQNAEIASSFAHALARAGKVTEAKRVLGRAMKRGASREQVALWKWLERGAPDEDLSPRPRPSPVVSAGIVSQVSQAIGGSIADHVLAETALGERAPTDAPRQELRPELRPSARSAQRRRLAVGQATGALEAEAPVRRSSPGARRRKTLDAALVRGLACLPLDTRQRARAKELARDVAARALPVAPFPDEEALAAAVAYAIVYVDHVPLTQAEVAGCFRVSVPNLRGRFKHLRTLLDLTPGDVRYATQRRR